MNKMEELPPINPQLCENLKNYEMINYGMAATIYKNDNIIFKEIYFSNEISYKSKINEYKINEYILKDKSLSKYIVPYYGGFRCLKNDISKHSAIILLFKYMNIPTLFQQLTTLTMGDFNHIFTSLKLILKKFNSKGISHNDLNSKNIFYDSKTKNIYIGDWGEAKFDNKNDDIEFWKNVIRTELIFAYFLKQNENKQNEFINFMKRTKLDIKYKNFEPYQKLINFYEKTIKYKLNIRLKNKTFPVYFITELEKLYSKIVLEEMYNNIPNFKNYITQHTKIPNNIKIYFNIN